MSISRAFLSHSSKDKEFVQAVARELGRQYCIFDEKSFDTGREFRESIVEGIDASSIFVLFASNNSLTSDWVDFELEEAWYKKLEKNLKNSLVYAISDSIDVDDLPLWLKRAKVKYANVPKLIAREIRRHLEKMTEERQNSFVGRSSDIQALQEALTPSDSIAPHVFFVVGLPGVGRRSLIYRVVPDILDLIPIKRVFRIAAGSRINDIFADVADVAEPYSTESRFQEIMKDIQQLSESDAQERTANNLRRLANSGELPIFIDEGGLFDEDGNISDHIDSLIRSFSVNDDAYIAIVCSRRPASADLPIAKIRLNPLTPEDQKLLIRTIDSRHIRASNNARTKALLPSQVSELAEYTAGYPPSVYAAMESVEQYGIDLVLAEKSKFTELRLNQFLKHFSNEKISDNEKQVLRLLATYKPLPLNIVASSLSIEMRELSSIVSRLMDLSFVVVVDRLYRVADPIEDAVIKSFGTPKSKVVEALAQAIIKLIDDPAFEEQRLDLHRNLYRTSWLVRDRRLRESVIFLFNDLIETINLIETIKVLYDTDREYSKVIEATTVALGMCRSKSDYETVISYKAKSYIRKEKWDEAEKEIDYLREHAPLRNVYYIRGFLNRRRGRTSEAIESYLEAKKNGNNGEAVNRELGLCYFLTQDYEKANSYNQMVLERQKRNKKVNFYSLDLQIQISMALGNMKLAESLISQLQDINTSAYYYRKSRFEFLVGDKNEAERFSEEAVRNSDDNPRFQVLVQLALCKITNKKIEDAEKVLEDIDRKFGKTNQDIRKGLGARLAIARGRYRDAFDITNQVADKSNKKYKKIRRDALQGYLEHCAMSDADRTRLDSELNRTKRELEDGDLDSLSLDVDDYLDLD